MLETEAPATDVDTLETDLLLEAVYRRYGYDFRNYARASLHRRISHLRQATGVKSISAMIPLVIHDSDFFLSFIKALSTPVTEMFRDPPFYRAFRQNVVPTLSTYPFIRLWHAGCASGEEVYSTAVLLQEEGLYHRTHIYATDMNPMLIETARAGIYSEDKMALFEKNYQKAGGQGQLSSYFTRAYGCIKINESLRRNITFACHSLGTDGVFAEVNAAICRNVLIYFDKPLKNRVLELFHSSLSHRGFLCLGIKETLRFSSVENMFETVDSSAKIYRKGMPRE